LISETKKWKYTHLLDYYKYQHHVGVASITTMKVAWLPIDVMSLAAAMQRRNWGGRHWPLGNLDRFVKIFFGKSLEEKS
jgi:hypothetical protein